MSKETLIRYRGIWMAFAIFWIILFHSSFSFRSHILLRIQYFGYGGVDIFLFASGLGCSLSYAKCMNPYVFFKNRVRKILPMYLIFIAFYIIYRQICFGISFLEIAGNILTIGYVAGLKNQFNWYLSCQWMLYLFVPFLYGLLKTRKKILCYSCMLVITILVGMLYFQSNDLIIMSRIPIFFIGMCFGDHFEEHDKMPVYAVVTALCLSVFGTGLLYYIFRRHENMLWSYGLFWYPFILIVPGLCIAVSLIFSLLEKWGWGRKIVRLLNIVGKYTLPLYLVHVLLYDIVDSVLAPKNILRVSNLSEFIVTLCIIPAAALLVGMEKIVKKILKI